MPKEETIEVRHVRSVVGEMSDLPKESARSSLASRIRSLVLRSGGLPHMINLLGVLETDMTLTISKNYPQCMFSDGNYLYVGTNTNPARVVKVDLATFTEAAFIEYSVGDSVVGCLGSDGRYLYAGLQVSPAVIKKIDLSNFTAVSSLTLTGGDNVALFMAFDGSYMYVGLGAGRVAKIDLTTFTQVTSIAVAGGVAGVPGMTFTGNNIYCTVSSAPGKISKIDVATFTEVSVLTLDAGESFASSGPIWFDGIYLYAAMGTSPGMIAKIDIPTFSKVSTMTLAAGENDIRSLFSDGTYLYAGTNTSPGKIVRIDIPSFTQSITYTLATGENIIYSMFTDGIYIYASARVAPGKIIRRYLFPNANVLERKMALVYELIHSGVYYVYPANAAPVTVTSGAGAYTKGNYAQVIPASTVKTVFYITGVVLYDLTANTDYEIDIATGAAASESIIGTVTHKTDNANLAHECLFPVPIKVAANTRVAARCSDGTGSLTCQVKVRYKL